MNLCIEMHIKINPVYTVSDAWKMINKLIT